MKVCGLTTLEDARLAARAGADYLGFILAESPRQLTPGKLIELTAGLREELSPGVCPDLVGVFLDQPLALINRIAEECQLDYIQLHGQESLEFCRQVSLPVFKSISVKDRKSLDRITQNSISLNTNIAAYLLDTYYQDKGGGGGECFNWQLLNDRRLQELACRKKIFLAGGLNPANVQEASCQPNITGLDVSSGLEITAGKKDPEKIRKFFNELN